MNDDPSIFPRSDLVPAPTRTYLYFVALAIVVLVTGYDLIAEDKLPLWIEVIRAVLAPVGLGTAAAYNPMRHPTS